MLEPKLMIINLKKNIMRFNFVAAYCDLAFLLNFLQVVLCEMCLPHLYLNVPCTLI